MNTDELPIYGTALRLGTIPSPVRLGSRVGISASALRGDFPLHGLRVEPHDNLSGWFLWCGEMEEHPDFFSPLHVEHFAERCPIVLPYLELPPGWRFVLAPGYEDVWYDPNVRVRD